MAFPLLQPLGFLVILSLSVLSSKGDTQIDWFSAQGAVNVTSNGVDPMDGGFRFELGVFSAGFTPTAGNIDQWVQNWNPAQRTIYKAALQRYTDSFMATNNAAPFSAGKAAYVWGFRGDPAQGEWMLFRASSWIWPTVSNGPPAFELWDAKDATAVIGVISSTGTPSLMKSAAVSDLPPPTTTWSQWVTDELAGETLTAPHEDADHDGTANIFEFIFGTSPKEVDPPLNIPFSLAAVSGSNYLQLSVPRRIDRPATITVEVSGDLKNWDSGSSHTVEVSNTSTSLVVRDLTPQTVPPGKRFIRLRAANP